MKPATQYIVLKSVAENEASYTVHSTRISSRKESQLHRIQLYISVAGNEVNNTIHSIGHQ